MPPIRFILHGQPIERPFSRAEGQLHWYLHVAGRLTAAFERPYAPNLTDAILEAVRLQQPACISTEPEPPKQVVRI